MKYANRYATTRNTGECWLFILHVAFWIVLCALKVRLLTSKVDNCNEVGSQLPHRAHISRASCLKNPAVRNDALVFSVCKMCRPPLGDPLKFTVMVAHRWRHLQYFQEFVFNFAGIRLMLLIR